MFYGQKAHSLRPLLSLPTRTDEKFLPALAIHPDEKKDLAALAGNGWRLLDPAEIATVLAFLAGPGSSAMTGSVVPVDGGLAL